MRSTRELTGTGRTLAGSREKCAFSLLELLVVIGIVALLAALILMTLSNGYKKGRQIQCANNLRQLGLAQEQFLSDYHGYPFHSDVLNPPNGYPKAAWEDALA